MAPLHLPLAIGNLPFTLYIFPSPRSYTSIHHTFFMIFSLKSFWQALIFLTTLPTPVVDWERGDLGRAAGYFPAVGFLLGGILYGVWWGFDLFLPPLIAAVLVIILWAVLTGGLHLDGLADCGDGVLAAVSRERRLEILKDSRVGAFGAITLVLHLFLKIALVASLTNPLGLILAPVVARWLLLPTAKRPLARPGGMGAEFAATIAPRAMWLGALFPLILGAGLGWAGVLGVVSAVMMMMLIWRLAQNRLGGITGDVFGLVVEMGETAVLLFFVGGLAI